MKSTEIVSVHLKKDKIFSSEPKQVFLQAWAEHVPTSGSFVVPASFSDSPHNSGFYCFQWNIGKMWYFTCLLKVSDNQASRKGNLTLNMESSSISIIQCQLWSAPSLTSMIHGRENCIYSYNSEVMCKYLCSGVSSHTHMCAHVYYACRQTSGHWNASAVVQPGACSKWSASSFM